MPAMLPPSTIHIKRKRTDDPVDLLHVQNEVGGGVRSVKQYVFKRQRISSTPATNDLIPPISETPDFISRDPAAPLARNINGIPQVIATKPGDELRDPYARRRTNIGAGTVAALQKNNGGEPASIIGVPGHEPRRFHMTTTPRSIIEPGVKKRRRDDKPPVAVFIERRDVPTATKTISSEPPSRKPSAAWQTASINPLKGLKPVTSGKTTPSGSIRLKEKSGQSTNLRTLQLFDQEDKETTVDASTAQNSTNASQSTTSDPSLNSTNPTPVKPSPYGRFKPRAPPRRADRDLSTQQQKNDIQVQNTQNHTGPSTEDVTSAENEDSIMKDVDDSDYVVDTYIRVPATSSGPPATADTTQPHPTPMVISTEAGAPTTVGLLILDSQATVDEFYNAANYDNDASSDSDNPYADDDEDENAENYVGNDYPDEDFDDEDDEAPYRYRTRNASDTEEFDVGEEEWREKERYRRFVDGEDEEDGELGDAMRRMGIGGGGGGGRPWMDGYGFGNGNGKGYGKRRGLGGEDDDEDFDGEAWNE